jgi:hypothetical protein
VSDPENTMRSLMNFVGAPYAAEQLNALGFKSLTSLHEVEHHKNLGRKIGAFSVGRYQQELSPPEILTFTAIAGRQLREFGYLGS